MLNYCWCGKYTSPSSEWMHIKRALNEYELFIITDGTLYIGDENNEYAIKKGEYLLMEPTKNQHGLKKSYASFYFLHFVYDKNDNDNFIIPSQGTLENINRIIILLNQLQDTDRRYHDKYTSDMLALGIIMEIKNQSRCNKVNNLYSKRERLYEEILDYIKWNKFRNISVSEIARHVDYNEKYISSIFKEMSGITLKKYIMQEKMEDAKIELIDTNKKISEIAESMGFSDNHNFSHAFKKVTGLTPTSYRVSCIKAQKTT